MAGYPTSKLDKAFARRANSAAARPTWQEWMSRHDTVPSFALQAPEVLQGFTGSWAAQYVLGSSQRTVDVPVTPAPVQRQGTHLGQPGLAEINFRPYDWGTTRHGKYGPSLLGHPISFEVVGPTLKSPFMLHQWVLDPTGPADILTLDTCTYRSTVGTPEALPAGLNSLQEIYNLQDNLGNPEMPEAGLYLLVSLTGAPGNLTSGGTGGLGDGLIGDGPVLAPIRTAITPPNTGTGQKAKFEIFRVNEITATTITLEGNKRIADFFTITPATTPIIRAVTLIKPAAARVVAVPGSGQAGHEQVFALVPPEKSLNSDIMPPFSTWQGGAFDPWLNYVASAVVGADADYAQANALPVPKVLRQGTGHLQGANPEVVASLAPGLMRVYLNAGVTFSATGDVGKVVHLHSINQVAGATWQTGAGNQIGDPELDRLLGYWEVTATGAAFGLNYYHLRMIAQVDPLTGVPFYGTTEYLQMAAPAPALKQVEFQWTLHEPISSLWTATYLQPDKLDSARLTNLIDPEWVRTTGKNIDLVDAEASSSRPDKAVFGTDGGDPGSLMDLGFRLVLFPAKVSILDPTKLVPDFSLPITTHEVVLDASLPAEDQFIEVDYSSGLITLSHAPNAVAGCQLVPDVATLTHAANPRGEVVFFASFVPFSQEPGQRSPAARVVGGQSVSGPGSACAGTESADLYGQRLHWPLEPGQTLTAGLGQEIQLAVTLTPLDLPPTGFVEVVEGYDAPVGSPAWTDGVGHRVSTWGYSSVYYADPGNAGQTTLLGCFGGGIAGVAVVTAAAAPYTAVLRRDLMTPSRADGSVGTDFQFDTTYGHNKRAASLRFKYGVMTQEPDGSVMLDTRDPLTVSHAALFSELFSSWVISGGEMLLAMPLVGATLSFTELVVLVQGVRTVVPAQPFVATIGGPSGQGYIYIDSTVPSCPVYARSAALPLPAAQDVLLGKYEYVGANVTTWTDLRQPLTDIDKRLDITVGNPQGFDKPADAHFLTLADAVAYARETMDPVSGVPGRFRRIKVIGSTEEDNAKLPIRPNMSGLIIEGAARRADGSLGNPTEVTWTGDAAPALFDLSGCSAITIRDLAFRYIYDANPSVVPRERCLFDITVGVATDILVENVRLLGPAHGLFYCNTDVDITAGFITVTLRNCVATELTDFAVYVGVAVTTSTFMNIEGCLLQTRKLTAVPGPEIAVSVPLAWPGDPYRAIIFGRGSRWLIQDCSLSGGYIGIFLFVGILNVANRVIIGATDKMAVVSLGSLSMSGAYITAGCYTVPGAVIEAFRIAVLGGSLTQCFVGALDTPVVADRSYFSSSSADLADCTFDQGVTVAANSKVQGSYVQDLLTLGSGSKAIHNKVLAGLAEGSIQAAADCILTGNVADGRLNPTVDPAATDVLLTNNTFLNTTFASNIAGGNVLQGGTFMGGIMLRGSQCILVGCIIWEGLYTPVSPGTQVSNLIQSCLLHCTTSETLYLGDVQFIGNRVNYTAAVPTLTLLGAGNVLEGNHFAPTLTLDASGALVQGNQLAILNLTANATGALLQGNQVSGAASFLGIQMDCLDNVFSSTVAASATNQRYKNNYFAGAITVGGVAGYTQDYVGNTFASTVTILAGANTYLIYSKLVGNTFVGAVDLNDAASIKSLDACVIQGNLFQSTSDFKYAFESTFTGNRHAGNSVLTSGSDNVVQGNVFGADLTMNANTTSDVTGNKINGAFSATTATGSIIQGNRVLGAVDLTGATGAVVNGNYFGSTLALTGVDEYVLTGNRVIGAVTVDDGAGAANTGVLVGNRVASVDDGLTVPTNNFVALGNKVDNGQRIFSAALGITSSLSTVLNITD